MAFSPSLENKLKQCDPLRPDTEWGFSLKTEYHHESEKSEVWTKKEEEGLDKQVRLFISPKKLMFLRELG